MTERAVAFITYARHPITDHLYGWLSLAEGASGVALGAGDARGLWVAATTMLTALYGGNPYHIEIVDVGYTQPLE